MADPFPEKLLTHPNHILVIEPAGTLFDFGQGRLQPQTTPVGTIEGHGRNRQAASPPSPGLDRHGKLTITASTIPLRPDDSSRETPAP